MKGESQGEQKKINRDVILLALVVNLTLAIQLCTLMSRRSIKEDRVFWI